MAPITINKALPFLGGLAMLFVVGVIMKVGLFDDGPNKARSALRATLPQPGAEPDADTPADTIRALQGQLATVNANLEATQRQNEQFLAENRKLQQRESKIRSEVIADMEGKLEQERTQQVEEEDRKFNRLTQRLERLQKLVTKVDLTKRRSSRPGDSAGRYRDIPVGLGLDSVSGLNVIWIKPMDATHDDKGNVIPASFRRTPDEPKRGVTEKGKPSTPVPFFTINNLATLAKSTAFTAMIGRVPIGGQVSDPIPFRILVGRENLAASGLRVPDEILGMVWEGVAIGDWGLSCVEGHLHTATFIFEDGTIRTVSTGKSGNAKTSLGQERLGYIADKFGTPCITGKRVSNAMRYLAARVGLKAGSAAAQAAAASETSTVVSGSTGAITSAVTGDKTDYIIGRTAAEGIDEVDRYIAERLDQTFDAIFVENGKELSIMVQKEISIDYDPVGRKLDYAQILYRHHTASLD